MLKISFIMQIILFVLILTSCVSKYMPVPADNIEISDEFAIMSLNDSTIAIKESLWSAEPKFLPNHFSTMHVVIQNRSNRIITVYPSDFAILNENKVQHDIVSNDVVLETVFSDPQLIPERFTIAAETQRENATRLNDIRRNIQNRGFSFGDIHPGAIKEGTLFFQRLDSKNQEFTFIYKSHEIKFKKTR
jgi:hypothetical protein